MEGEAETVPCQWRSVLGRGHVLTLAPSVQTVATGLTNVVCTKQAPWHAVSSREMLPLMLRTSPRPPKRGSHVSHWLRHCSMPANTLGKAHRCWSCSHPGIPVKPAPTPSKPLTLKPRELLYVLPRTQGTPLKLFLCFPSLPHLAPSALMIPASHWSCWVFLLQTKNGTFPELSSCYPATSYTLEESRGVILIPNSRREITSLQQDHQTPSR